MRQLLRTLLILALVAGAVVAATRWPRINVVETGRTLEENGLTPVEEVAASTARLIVNRASYHARRDVLAPLLARLQGAA